ncbi:epimerase [Humidisolicoccus flavus]|uniref:epimerase n=1 Tax=Humidisolicoccus flavus TaxID=3111414 RepID=UPI00324BEFA2
MTLQQRVVLAGASGFVGRHVSEALELAGYTVVRIGRAEPISWNDPSGVREAIDGAEAVINLAGKSVNCRYTTHNREEIFRSRVETTRILGEAIASATAPPTVWLNASTATIYRYAMDLPMNEHTGEFGQGFSVDVAKAWENELFAADTPSTRKVALRMAIVLGDGGATTPLLTLAKLGLGGAQFDGPWFSHRRYRGIGPQASEPKAHNTRSRGLQRVSWIDIRDVTRAILWILIRSDLEGPVNLATPHSTTNRRLMRTVRSVVGAKFGFGAFRWMLEPAMWLLRTEPELILKSRWAEPARLLESGFTFEHTSLRDTLADALVRLKQGRDRVRYSPSPKLPLKRERI